MTDPSTPRPARMIAVISPRGARPNPELTARLTSHLVDRLDGASPAASR